MNKAFTRKAARVRPSGPKATPDMGGSFTHTTEVGPTCFKHGQLHHEAPGALAGGVLKDIMEIYIPERPDGSWPEVTATFCVRCFVDHLSGTIGPVRQAVKVVKG